MNTWMFLMVFLTEVYHLTGSLTVRSTLALVEGGQVLPEEGHWVIHTGRELLRPDKLLPILVTKLPSGGFGPESPVILTSEGSEHMVTLAWQNLLQGSPGGQCPSPGQARTYEDELNIFIDLLFCIGQFHFVWRLLEN